MNRDFKKLLSIAEEAALQSGKYLKDLSSRNVNLDEGKDIKLEADKKSEEIIFSVLQKNSQIPIISEESYSPGQELPETYWIVDPIDGTYNYFRGLLKACVCVGLIHKETPVLGVIYDFKDHVLYKGAENIPATKNNSPILVSSEKNISKACLFTGFPVGFNFNNAADYLSKISHFKKVRMIGSAALSIIYVAEGLGDYYFEQGIRLWDIAPSLAILSSAGGEFYFTMDKKTLACEIFASNKKLPLRL